MSLLKGKWIRIECDAELPDDYYHPGSTADEAHQTQTYNELIQICINNGWKNINGKWICPHCQEHNSLLKTTTIEEYE